MAQNDLVKVISELIKKETNIVSSSSDAQARTNALQNLQRETTILSNIDKMDHTLEESRLNLEKDKLNHSIKYDDETLKEKIREFDADNKLKSQELDIRKEVNKNESKKLDIEERKMNLDNKIKSDELALRKEQLKVDNKRLDAQIEESRRANDIKENENKIRVELEKIKLDNEKFMAQIRTKELDENRRHNEAIEEIERRRDDLQREILKGNRRQNLFSFVSACLSIGVSVICAVLYWKSFKMSMHLQYKESGLVSPTSRALSDALGKMMKK